MEVKNLKDLSQIIDLCRKKGVDSVEISGIRLSFKGEASPSKYQKRKLLAEAEENTAFIDEISREEAALFWSSTPAINEGAN